MPSLTLNGSPSTCLALLPEQSAERETGAKRGALPAGALADRAPIRHAALPIKTQIMSDVGSVVVGQTSVVVQGNRLKASCGDVGGKGVFVPCGDFAAHAQ